MSVTICRIFVRGRVQGVGFRAFVEEEASARGLSGFVRNRRDGSVEAIFSGPGEIVEAAIAACRRGPPAAFVETLDVFKVSEADVETISSDGRFVVLTTQ